MSSKHKTDPVDSRGIADLLRSNQFPVAYAYPPEMRPVRDLLRRRHFFVRQRAGTLTHFQNTLHQDGCIESLRNRIQNKSTRNSLVELTDNADVKRILSTDLEHIESLDALILSLDKTIVKRARHHNAKHFEILQTIPGCGIGTALTVLYEIHTIDRFRSPQCFSSYCRVVRAENESAGKNLGGTSNDKIGNPYLKWAFSQIGQSMINNYAEINTWFQKQAAVCGKAKAHARLRHKIAVTAYCMLKNDTVFDIVRFFGTKSGQAENPSQKGTETSGHLSEPVLPTENPPGHLTNKIPSGIRKRRTSAGRLSLRTTGMRKVLTKSATHCG
jgi:transposase